MPKEITLVGKMNHWGPFEEREGQWLVFSVGNPEEGHGAALPRSIDDLSSIHVATSVARRAGQRYVAHIPYTTDHCVEVARDWAPRYLPFADFLAKTREFLQYHLAIYRDLGLPARKVFIFSGHGGNDDLAKHTDELRDALELEEMIVVTGDFAKDQIGRVLQAVGELAERLTREGGSHAGEDPDDLAFKMTQVLTTAGHASHFEHTFAAALDLVDWAKLEQMNAALVEDFEAALERWPPIGGLGGFLLAGGKYTEQMGTKDDDQHGLWNCLRGLRELDGGKLVVMPELGAALMELAIEYLAGFIDGREADEA